MRTAKRYLAGVLTALMVLSLASCGSKPAPGTPGTPSVSVPGTNTPDTTTPGSQTGERNAAGLVTPTATAKDTLVIGNNFDPGTMDPYGGSFGPQLLYTTQSMESLFLYDAKGNVIPWLAESCKYDEDQMGLTLHLRQGVTFQNGSPMTADDVVFSFRCASQAPGPSAFMSVINWDGVEAVDENTVYVPLKWPSGTMADTLTNLFVVSKDLYEGEKAAGGGITGTGPWKVNKWQAGVSCTFDAYEGYWGGAPVLKHLEIRIISESSVRMIELENGNIDIYKGAAALDIQRVAGGGSPGLALWRASQAQACHFFGFNCSRAPFDNQKVREALCYAIDTQTLALAVFENIGEEAQSFLPFGVWYSPTLSEEQMHRYDPEKAKALLAEAGYPDGLTVDIKCDGNVYRTAMAEMLPSMLEKSGITANVVIMETAAYNEWKMSSNDYDLFMGNFGNLTEPGGALRAMTGSSNKPEGGGNGMWHYGGTPLSDRIDELLNAAGAEPDTAKRAAIYQELAELVADEAVSKPVADFYDTNLVAGSLKGMFYSPNINVQYAYFE